MVNEYENLLRNIILEILGNEVKNYKISPDRIQKWIEKKEIENKKDKRFLEDRLIYYSDFYDLKNIILKNWDLFLPILKSKKRFETFFDEIENYRNSVAHGRTLTQGQNLLLEGILIDLKVAKTIYHNKNEMKEDYFLRIEKVSDNFGNVFTDSINQNNKILRVGDFYEILIEAVDPKGRQIEYELKALSKKFSIIQNHNRFNFTIPESLIGASVMLIAHVKTPSSEYENQDHQQIFVTVLPK